LCGFEANLYISPDSPEYEGTMNMTCIWCDREICDSGSQNTFSIHGICQNCSNNLIDHQGVDLYHYLDSLPAPVILVGRNVTVKYANSKAQAMLGKELSEIEGCPPGLVLECEYAQLPGGCGKTGHCTSCSLRKAILNTLETGKQFAKTLIYLQRGNEGDLQGKRLLISSRRSDDIVMLRIDEEG
jgi:PAS domain-containing protein